MGRGRAAERGFTMVEVLVALAIMAVGLIGILALQRGAVSASGYSRRATEAAILAEDKLEELRTAPLAVIDDVDRVDASGLENPDGPFDRAWSIGMPDAAGLSTITVAVTWNEADGAHTLTFRTLREVIE